MWSLPIDTVATLSVGLRENSRIILKLKESEVSLDTMLLAGINDRLSAIMWQLSGGSNTDKPTMITDSFIKREEKPDNDKFASGEEFMKFWRGE